MNARRQNLVLVGILVVAFVVIGYFLRSPNDTVGTGTEGPTTAASSSSSPSPTVSPSTSASASPSASGSPSPSPSASATAPKSFTKVAFIGDSYAEGIGASDPSKRWSTLLSAANNWTETNVAHQQSGYLKTGARSPCTAESCPAYTTVVPQVVQSGAELVILTGGANDLGQDQAAAAAAVAKTLTDLRAGLPNAVIVVVNPWWDMRVANPALSPYTEAIKAAAAAAGVTFADTGQPIVGRVDRVTSDGLHANDAGHQALAETVRSALKLAGLPVS
jgi:lysophospholipase L1-like esterase